MKKRFFKRFSQVLLILILTFTMGCHLPNNKETAKEFINACKANNISEIKLMLAMGVDPDITDDGLTGLMVAAYNGYIELTQLLLKKGANVNKKYYGTMLAGLEGQTALYFAISGYAYYKKHDKQKAKRIEKIALLLVDKGIDINSKTEDRSNYLMQASWAGMESLIKKLIKKGIDVNYTIPDGFTALMVASKNGHFNIVKLLLEHGANPNLKVKKGEYKGYTALKLAEKKGYKDIVKLLKQYGAKEE
ncbi:conserved hypothetical protein [Thermotomaculum hydrothermale]|uniref:Ankyrin n=1 Tax=Thermotomaculum hydrothermale TaxID=981385 RepID=A0A7R6SYJ5_9BACT|nr:ankyrin repeat domain-containing protein [Thermotomaculum hydrothermale]BBB32710.1 conserved hypothetical protein [Thermotomaculum hydrothermale]